MIAKSGHLALCLQHPVKKIFISLLKFDIFLPLFLLKQGSVIVLMLCQWRH